MTGGWCGRTPNCRLLGPGLRPFHGRAVFHQAPRSESIPFRPRGVFEDGRARCPPPAAAEDVGQAGAAERPSVARVRVRTRPGADELCGGWGEAKCLSWVQESRRDVQVKPGIFWFGDCRWCNVF